MSVHDERPLTNGAHHDDDHDHDLSAEGIVLNVRADSESYLSDEPRDAFNRDVRSPSPPMSPTQPQRFFVGAHSSVHTNDSETASSVSPVLPGISVTNASAESLARADAVYDSPNIIQNYMSDPFGTPTGEIPPSVRNMSHFDAPDYDDDDHSPPSSPRMTQNNGSGSSGGIAARRPGLNNVYSNPYIANMNSINFQSSQNHLLGSPGSPMMSPALASPRGFPQRMLQQQTSNASLRDALSSPPPRMLHSSMSVPALRGSPRLGHASSMASLRPGTPGGKPKPRLRRQRSTALPDYDEPKVDPETAKKKKPRYYNPHDSSIPKPWLKKKDRNQLWSRILTYLMASIGILLSVLICYNGAMSVKMVGKVCLVFEDDFSGSTLNSSIWGYDAEMGGFGNGEFEIMTTSSNNTFIEDGILYIVPTLTSDAIGQDAIFNNYVYNLTDCSVTNITSCSAVSNSTTKTIINPVQSGRIHTKVNGSTSAITYGRIEVRARLPEGDWLWPAIWMLPVNNTYGKWPVSGEIDIMEGRGNNATYPFQGDNYVRGSLNWGPNQYINSVWKTYGWHRERRSSYNEDFHTYTLEWTDEFLRVYVDSRLKKLLDIRYAKKSFWEIGDYPANMWNGTQEIPIPNPWAGRGNSAPFDQDFYLILNVAVGGTNGWFPDNAGGKPWLDGSLTAMYDFAKAQDQWYPTWPSDLKKRGMAIDSVKMWQQC